MQKKGLFQKLKSFFFGPDHSQDFDEIEDILIEADLGYKTAQAVRKELELAAKADKIKTKEQLFETLRAILKSMVRVKTLPYDAQKVNLYLFLGVNGVGKTTSIAKLTKRFLQEGKGPILLAAGDTFRAAAIEQIQLHGKRQGVRVVGQEHGSDPGAVLFDSLESAKAQGERIVLADTAGRMHNKSNLVKELQKIHKIAQTKIEGGVYQKILVIDATTGQNAFQQAQVFHEAVGVDGIVLSKYDSSGKGGIAVSVSRELELPFLFYGTGERPEDLKVFDVDEFVEGLLGARDE